MKVGRVLQVQLQQCLALVVIEAHHPPRASIVYHQEVRLQGQFRGGMCELYTGE